jgi:hypothetical protein
LRPTAPKLIDITVYGRRIKPAPIDIRGVRERTYSLTMVNA